MYARMYAFTHEFKYVNMYVRIHVCMYGTLTLRVDSSQIYPITSVPFKIDQGIISWLRHGRKGIMTYKIPSPSFAPEGECILCHTVRVSMS